MLPHNAQGFGWGKLETRVKVWMSEYHDNAIKGVVTGSASSFHELRANISTLIGGEDGQRCQSSCRIGGSV
jgi:hypothetical protein